MPLTVSVLVLPDLVIPHQGFYLNSKCGKSLVHKDANCSCIRDSPHGKLLKLSVLEESLSKSWHIRMMEQEAARAYEELQLTRETAGSMLTERIKMWIHICVCGLISVLGKYLTKLLVLHPRCLENGKGLPLLLTTVFLYFPSLQ